VADKGKRPRPGNDISLEDLDESFSDGDSLASAINSALMDAEKAISKKDSGTRPETTVELDDSLLGGLAPAAAEEKPTGLAELPEQPQEVKDERPSREQEYYERLLRVTADFENFRKRVQRDKEDYFKFASEDLLTQLLPVLDNLERAIAHAEETKESTNLVEGVRMILRQLQDVLKKNGVRSFESLGKPFDPSKHQAMQILDTTAAEPNTVIQVFQRGYFLHDRLIRPAMVVVSRRPAKSAGGVDLPQLGKGEEAVEELSPLEEIAPGEEIYEDAELIEEN